MSSDVRRYSDMREREASRVDLRPLWRRWLAGDSPAYVQRGRLKDRLLFLGLGAGLAGLVALVPLSTAPTGVATGATTGLAPPAPAAAPVVPPPAALPPPAEPSRPLVPTPALVPPAPAATTGRLRLSTKPAVTAFVGDRSLGRTPIDVELDPGKHTIRLVDRRRLLSTRRSFDITAGQTLRRRVDFDLGRLTVTAPKGAKISVDGRAFGRAPIAPIELAAGKHTLRIRYRGKDLKVPLKVEDRGELTYNAHWTDAEDMPVDSE